MSDYQEIREQLTAEKKKGSTVILPSPIMDIADSFYMPVVELVKLRNDEIYKAQGNYRIHYNGLLRLSHASGFVWHPVATCRTDNGSDKDYCSFRAVGGVRKADGTISPFEAHKDISLSDLEEEFTELYTVKWEKMIDLPPNQFWKRDGHKTSDTYIPAMVRRDMRQKRKNKLMLVESGAKARVIRFVLGIQGQYSDVKKLSENNFVVVRYTQNPNHPDVKAALLQQLHGSMNMIYGVQQQLPQSIPDDQDVVDVAPEPEIPPTFTPPEPLPEVERPFMDKNWFESQPVNKQEAWLRSACEEQGHSWDDLTSELNGRPMAEAVQAWRNGLFNFLKGPED